MMLIPAYTSTRAVLEELLAQRILVLDGSMGAFIYARRSAGGGLPRHALPQPSRSCSRTAPKRWC